MFTQRYLKKFSYDELMLSCNFEEITHGRKGGVLVDNDNYIIRTTTNYVEPASKFLPIHYEIMESIHDTFIDWGNIKFNNALIEVYDNNYRNMGYHSDQSLDLASESFIGIYSNYKNPTDRRCYRKLKIRHKTRNEFLEFTLEPDSVVIFSTNVNSEYLHKIILENTRTAENEWLGITFRLSKTSVNFIDDVPYLSNGKMLTLCNNEQKKDFLKWRRLENKNIEFLYPEINYTCSMSDMLPPK